MNNFLETITSFLLLPFELLACSAGIALTCLLIVMSCACLFCLAAIAG